MMLCCQSRRNQFSPKTDFTTIFSKCWVTSMGTSWDWRVHLGFVWTSPAGGALAKEMSSTRLPRLRRPLRRHQPLPRQQHGRMVPAPSTSLPRLLPVRVPKLAMVILRPARALWAASKPGRRCGWKIKLPWAYPNCCAHDLSIQEPGISNFEHAYVRITWDKALEKRLDWDIPGYPCDSLGSAQTRRYPYLSQHIPSYTELYHRGISRDIPVQESYPCISQNNFSIPTDTGISRDRSQVGLSRKSRYVSGFGRMSFFQMLES